MNDTFRRLLILLALCAPALAQKAEIEKPSALQKRGRRMLREAIASRRSHALLASLLETAPGRLSGSPSAARAVAWGRKTMTELGLENVRLEKVMVPRWVRGETCEVTLLHPDGGGEKLAAVALGGSIGTGDGSVEGEVVEVKSLKALRNLGKKGVTGKIVLWNQPFDDAQTSTFQGYGGAVWQRTIGAVEAGMRGARAVLVRSVTSMPDDVPHTGAMRYKEGVPKIPAAAVSVVAAERLAAALASGRRVRVRMRMDCRTLPDVESANVIGEIRGSVHPEEIVLIGAHLDSWDVCPGAHDDGAGVAHVLEAARLILSSGPRPRRTIRVVLFINEENGLRGGRAYARDHAAEIPSHVLAIETDSGGFAPLGFAVTPARRCLPLLTSIGETLEHLALGHLMGGGGGADISPLRNAGVPVMGLRVVTDRYFDYHHSAKDTLDKVHPRELARGAAAVAIMALGVADMEPGLRRAMAPETR